MKIQTDLPKELHKKLKMHQVKHDIKMLPDALNDVVERFFKQYKKK